MQKVNELSIQPKTGKNGYKFVEAQKCGNCGHVQPTKELNHMNKDTFMALTICYKCGSPVVTCFGDKEVINDFMTHLQLDINPRSM